MEIGIGVKSDPIQYRYTYEWLFDLMKEQKVRYWAYAQYGFSLRISVVRLRL